MGDNSNIPHSGIGRARRMQVSKTEFQHQIMIEAVENHMPEAIIIDDIGTTHGNRLENLIKNPSLFDLIGGIQYVTLSDEEAKRRGTQKTILERKAYPAFQVVIEINEQNSRTIHENVKNSIDFLLCRDFLFSQTRHLSTNNKTIIKHKKIKKDSLSFIKNSTDFKKLILRKQNSWTILNQKSHIQSKNLRLKSLLIYNYSLTNNLVKEAGYRLGFRLLLTIN